MDNTNNIIVSLLGLAIASLIIKKACDTREGFAGNMVAGKVKVQQVAQDPRDPSMSFYTVPGNYQSMLTPVGGSGMTNYGAYIRYRPPSNQFTRGQNFPAQQQIDPVITEKFQPAQNFNMPSVSSGSYNQEYNQLGVQKIVNQLPAAQSADSRIVNAIGEAGIQPVVFDRFIFANAKSRYARNGVDRIRGDIAIVPVADQWFRPSADPQIDLNSGALAAIAGVNNTSNKQLLALQNAATAGILDTGSGINYAVQKSSYMNNMGDVRVSAFP